MLSDSVDTIQMNNWVARWQAGDRLAADELLRAIGPRLEHLTRKMLRNFPGVRSWTETGDVLQTSLVRLLDTLRHLQPTSTRHFFNLAAMHIHRELLNLARHFRAERFSRLIRSVNADDSRADALAQAPDPAQGDPDLEWWCRFHEAVEELPEEEREVVGLRFYHGWTQAQIAELFQVNERTVRRRWQSACLRLHDRVGKTVPES